MMYIYSFFIFLLGTSLGSFLNALEYRLHTGQPFVRVRSHCPACKKQLAWYDNIPLLSFALLRGACRSCSEKISWQYPVVELWMGAIFVLLTWFAFFQTGILFPTAFLYWFVVWVLTFIFVYDLKYMEVVDTVTLGAAGIIFVVGGYMWWNGWFDLILGALVGGGFFLFQYVLSKGRWVGGGDVRIGVLMGVILGWKLLLLALWIAYVIGAVVSIGLIVGKKKNMRSQMPFGVFLMPATLVVMLWGSQVLYWYMKFFK